MKKTNTREMRVIGVPWHTGHQYELMKIYGKYDLLLNHYRKWGDVSRPRPSNSEDVVTLDKNNYDLAILHIDQQCVHEDMGKHKLFMEFKELTEGMDRVVINHMTPFDDSMDTNEVISTIKDMVGDIPMITNSKQAARQWGWGTPIIHGLSPEEWHDLPKEPRVVTSLSPAGMTKAYRRELLHATIELLKEKGIQFVWIQVDQKMNTFEDYRDFLGRSLLYLNPTWQSPMPRSRTEALFSGCCVISTRHHDWDEYIEDGVNGFIIPDNPKSAAKLIEDLIMNRYAEAKSIGQKGKQLAIDKFHINRWEADWNAFLRKEGILQ